MDESRIHPSGGMAEEGAGDAWKRDIPVLDRFLDELVSRSWRELVGAAGPDRKAPESSGVLPVGHPGLTPFLSQPGVFLVVGPPPTLSLLSVGQSGETMDEAVRTQLSLAPDRAPAAGEAGSPGAPPAFLALLPLRGRAALAPLLAELLRRRLQAHPVPSCAVASGRPSATDASAPLLPLPGRPQDSRRER
jgi:hypothetical protein